MKRSALRLLAGTVLMLLLVAALGTTFVWTKIGSLKKQLAASLEDALGAQVQISSLEINVWECELRAEGISLVNRREGAPWEKGNIGKAVAHFKLSELLANSVPLRVEVFSWSLVLKPNLESPQAASQADSSSLMENAASVPSRRGIRITQMLGEDGQVEIDLAENRKVLVKGVSFEANDNGLGDWLTILKVATVNAGTLQAGPGSVTIRGDAQKIQFSEMQFQCDQGSIDGNGEVLFSPAYSIVAKVRATNVPATMLVAVEWQMKLSGLTSGELSYQADSQNASAHGQFNVSKGKCNLLPFLGKVTAVVNLPDLDEVEFDKATANFEWKDHALHLSELDIRKQDVARIAGEMQVDSTGQLDGRLKFGLPSIVTARWPALQVKIFSVQFEDYNWTEVHLTGSVDHLQEDLSPRLLAVTTDQGASLLNDATKGAAELLNGLLNK